MKLHFIYDDILWLKNNNISMFLGWFGQIKFFKCLCNIGDTLNAPEQAILH